MNDGPVEGNIPRQHTPYGKLPPSIGAFRYLRKGIPLWPLPMVLLGVLIVIGYLGLR